MNRDIQEPVEFSMASTRVVWPSGGQPVAFAPEVLEGMARRINDGAFLPIHTEHLSYLPPSGRIASARLVTANDGALELIGVAEPLPHLNVNGDPPSPSPSISSLPLIVDENAPAPFQLLLEPRNFEPADFAKLATSAPVPVRGRSQWAELPPLEILIVLQVTTGLAVGLGAFWKKFMEELGVEAAKAVADWIRSARQQAKAPERDLLLAARFELPSGAIISGYIPIPVNLEHTIEARLSTWVDLARVAEEFSADEATNIQQMTFIHDGEQWRLAWFVTTGEAVYITAWGRDHTPDPARFLAPAISSSSPT